MNNCVKISLLIFSFIIGSATFAQDFTEEEVRQIIAEASEKEIVELNTVMNINEEYYHALLTADKLLEFQPNNANYLFRKGYAIMKSSDDFTRSKPYLEKAVTKISKNYDLFSTKEKGAPVSALFHLGKLYHHSKKIDKALDYYNQYLDRSSESDEYHQKAQTAIQQCNVAKKQIDNPVDYEVENLGNGVNSKYPDYSPVISLDGSAIYFTSRRIRPDSSNAGIKEPGTNLYLEDIYVSYKDFNDNWIQPRLMEFCTPDHNEATMAVSIDERRIYAYKDVSGNGDIYYSDFEGSQFRDLKKLETKGVNTKAWEPHMTVAPDGTFKLFASDRKGGLGGRDIYRIDKLENGKWSKPVNVGAPINSEYDEDAPFIAIDNETIYFAHNGPKSMGGFDIFKTTLKEDGSWSVPENLGYPLNSTGDDIYYTTTVDGFTGYLTSFRPSGLGEKDIYEIKNKEHGVEDIAVLKGEIETSTGDPLPEDVAFTVKCLNCEEPYEISLFPRISDGTFFASLYPCREYEVTFHYDNAQTEISKEIITTSCDKGYEEIYRHIVLDLSTMSPVDQKELLASYEPLKMKHFFGYNKNQLDPEKGALKIFLDSLQQQIDRGRSSVELTINSSASEVPTKTFENNEVLAQKRANELKQLLINYFEEQELNNVVDVIVDDIQVAGPEYQEDWMDIEKYAPYQFASINLDGVNSMGDEIVQLESEDEEVKKGVVQRENTTMYVDEQGDEFHAGQMIESDYNYHVITGVFNRIKYAEGMVQNLKDKGFEGKIIGKRNGMHVVSAGSSNKISGVKELLERARREVSQSSWILNTKQ